MLVLAVGVPERCDVSVGEALVDAALLADVRRTCQQSIVMRQIVLPLLLCHTHKGLDGTVGGQTAAQEQVAVAGEKTLEELRKWEVEVDVPVVAIGGVVFALFRTRSAALSRLPCSLRR